MCSGNRYTWHITQVSWNCVTCQLYIILKDFRCGPMSPILSSNLLWQQEQTAQPEDTFSMVTRESDYRWTLPVKWDWLLISGGRSGGSDSVGTLSGSPPCRYMLCEEAAPLRSITHTSVWETDMKHVPLNVWRSHIKTWMLHLCVSCWPDSWAL